MSTKEVAGQWVVCYRISPEDTYRVYASAYDIEQVRQAEKACHDKHPHAEVWASPSGKVPYPVAESGPSDPAG